MYPTLDAMASKKNSCLYKTARTPFWEEGFSGDQLSTDGQGVVVQRTGHIESSLIIGCKDFLWRL